MKKIYILHELLKCDTETQSEQSCEQNGRGRPAGCLTSLQFVKQQQQQTTSVKHSQVKSNKRGGACIVLAS